MDITFPTTCNKNKFDDYKFKYDAITIGLISDWTKVSCSPTDFQTILTNINLIMFDDYISFWTLVLININPKLTFVQSIISSIDMIPLMRQN